MKYAREVQDLIPAFPNHQFSMENIVNHVSRGMKTTACQRAAMERQLRRVMNELVQSGLVKRTGTRKGTRYQWQFIGH